MLTDYHVHIERGPYSFEWLDQFMETAQKQQVEEVGIVEHSHRFQEMNFMYAGITQDATPVGQYQQNWLKSRLGLTTIPAYVDFMQEAKKRGYPVKMGLEICYFPEFEEETRQVLQRIEPDFIIGSVHWLSGWGFDHPATREEWARRNKPQIAEEYNLLLLKAIRSGLFDIIGHIDSVKAFAPWGINGWLKDEVLQAVRQAGICIEVNTGVKYRVDCPEYCPSEEILRTCLAHGIDITLASDAHNPGDVGKLFEESVPLIKRIGYQETIRFKERQKYKVQL